MKVYPSYYKYFRCIAEKCKHNCCIGWEIDIDNNTLEFYKSVKGDFSKRLSDNISFDGTPHFILQKDERCPFLNEHNLCDIITTLGESALCDICDMHPRFNNELPDRVECGLGLCCEEAGRIILGAKEKITLVSDDELATDDEIIILRDEIIKLLQNREKNIFERLEDMLKLCDTQFELTDINYWCDTLLGFERMDDKWEEALNLLKISGTDKNESFSQLMAERESEYEQFAIYILYRHFANAPDFEEAQQRAKLVAFSTTLLYLLGCAHFENYGEFTFETQVELARLFSSEIEYSDENLYTLIDML